MKAAVYHSPRNMTVEDIPLQHAGPDDIVVKVHAAGVCGSDLHGYKLGLWVEPGEIMGHEWAGEVVEVGKNVRHLKVGDRVTVGDGSGGPSGSTKLVGYGLPGAYAEYMHMPNVAVPGRVGLMPDELTYEEAAALEPLRCGLFAGHMANARINDWAVVIGAGIIGISCMYGLKLCGSCRVIAVDISDVRLELARELGAADIIVNAQKEDALARVKELTGEGVYYWGAQAHGRYSLGARADVVIEAAGKGATLVQALEMVKHGGTVVQMSLFEETVAFDPTIITQKHIKLLGCAGGLSYSQAADLVRTGRVNIKPFITHRFPLDKTTEAFETQMRSEVTGKVVVMPWMS